MRKVILFLLGVGIIGGALYFAKDLASKRSFPKPKEKKVVTNVFADVVKNGNIPITITTSGRLVAKNRLELYSEVQGLFKTSAHDFKPGVWYKKGESLLDIDSDEHTANLRSQKSNLLNQIVLLLPDLRLDYSTSFPNWEKYVSNFNVEGPLQSLPEPTSEKEKLFITGKNLYTSFYNVKALEERLIKYRLRAPYTGVLTQALVTPGTLVRAGQKLGEFIDPSVYELAVPINTSYGDRVQRGQSVILANIERTKEWTGKVIRVNSLVDPATQSIQIFISVRGKGLREGMFLEADLAAREQKNAYEIDRKLLVNDNQVFFVQDSLLSLQDVETVYFKENSVVISGLTDGMKLLSKPVPGAFPGMRVQVLENLEGISKPSL